MKRVVALGVSLLAMCVTACDSGDGGATAQSAKTSEPATSASGTTEKASSPKVPGVLGVTDADKAANEDPKAHDGKQMKVSGVVAKVGSQTAGPKGKKSTTYYIKLVPAQGKTKPRVFCQVGKEEPKVKDGAELAVEGKVRLNKMGSKDGGTTYMIELRDCKVL